MGAHINEHGQFQSDKYPTCPAGKVPLSVRDETAQDLLWEYAKRRRSVDAEFSDDLETVLRGAGFAPLVSVDLDGGWRKLDDVPALEGRPNLAIAVFAHGHGRVIDYDVDGWLEEFISDYVTLENGEFNLDGIDHSRVEGFAILVGKLQVCDDGPGDWPGSRECMLQFTEARPVTAEEWKAYLAGEYWTPSPAPGTEVNK